MKMLYLNLFILFLIVSCTNYKVKQKIIKESHNELIGFDTNIVPNYPRGHDYVSGNEVIFANISGGDICMFKNDTLLKLTPIYITHTDWYTLTTKTINEPPYISIVRGNFDFIDSIKCIEYSKALIAFKEIKTERIKQNKINKEKQRKEKELLELLNNKKCK